MTLQNVYGDRASTNRTVQVAEVVLGRLRISAAALLRGRLTQSGEAALAGDGWHMLEDDAGAAPPRARGGISPAPSTGLALSSLAHY